ncbi:MAG TPA: cytochrome d ubiquinol oxidase subunit II [Gemmatimonadales bacterium]|nr:cytochrome d ubiquinol oxidase subunit II [Gemmatimonadales bacterium]
MPESALAAALAAAVMASLNAYVLLGGADFGGGVWDLLAGGPRRDRQRALVADAIGPIWEANHVWLILVIVLLFTCFPAVFARLSIGLHIPLSLMLVGIVLRGSAFTFRTYDSQRDDVQRRWGRIFAGASIGTPVLLGISVGTIASGAVRVPAGEGFAEVFVRPWLQPFPLAVGLLTLVLFAFLAAVYLMAEADDPALREDFRHRALGAGVAAFGAAALALVLAREDAPLVWNRLLGSAWAVPVHLATAVFAVAALAAIWRRRAAAARLAAAAQVTCILWGWALSQYPFLLPPDLTYRSAAAPAVTLRLVLAALAIGSIVLVPSLYYLFRVFKGRPA